jgi:hypothetical protein
LASATQEQLDSQFWFDRTIEKFTTTLRIVPRARSCSAARGSKVEMQVYPGAYHGFDRANSPVREFPEYRTSVGVVLIQGTGAYRTFDDQAVRAIGGDAISGSAPQSLAACRLASLVFRSALTPEHAEGRWTGDGPFFELQCLTAPV